MNLFFISTIMILHKLHLNLLNKKLISTFPLYSRVIHLNSVNQNRLVKWCKEFWKSEMGPNPLPYTHCTQIGNLVVFFGNSCFCLMCLIDR